MIHFRSQSLGRRWVLASSPNRKRSALAVSRPCRACRPGLPSPRPSRVLQECISATSSAYENVGGACLTNSRMSICDFVLASVAVGGRGKEEEEQQQQQVVLKDGAGDCGGGGGGAGGAGGWWLWWWWWSPR